VWWTAWVGLEGVRAEVAMVETPDGHGRLELVRFHAPSGRGGDRHAPANTPGIRHLAILPRRRCRHRADPERRPTLLNGWDTLTFAALAAGVRAVVWGAASIVPEQCVELHRLLIDAIDLPAARELWARLWPLCQFLEGQSYPAAVKTACSLVGDSTGPVRPPLLPLDQATTSELSELVDHATLAHAAR
jgi:hypothetical protein